MATSTGNQCQISPERLEASIRHESPQGDTDVPIDGSSSLVEEARGLGGDSARVCPEHERNPEDKNDYKLECDICERNYKRLKTERQRARFAEMQIGRRFHDCQWRHYQTNTAQQEHNKLVMFKYAKSFDEALKKGTSGILLGNHGTGKNMLSALVCKTLAQNDFTALHTTVARLIRRVRQTWRSGSVETEEAVLKAMVDPDLLVIDEVGVQSGSQNEQHILTEIINDRYEAMKPVLLISNLKFDELENLLGTRIIDRFYEGGSFILTFDWESYRRKNNE